MRRLLRRGASALLLSIGVSLAAAGVASATDDYTLPFYDPDVTLSYGVDRDPGVARQLDFTGQLWFDDDLHPGRVYDQHTGIDYPMAIQSQIAAASAGWVIDVEGGFGTSEFGSFGNFVQIEHPDGLRSLSYHLASAADGGQVVHVGEAVVAGELIGLSGCSGTCYGAHLHFELRRQDASDAWVVVDPQAERKWTTWPGRVPFLAAYVRESNAGTEVVRRGQTVTHWVEFRNLGGRVWRSTGAPGRIVLGTWDPASHASPFKAADWSSSWLATAVDMPSVAPDQVGRFTFGLRGGPPPGSYRETFNLLAVSVHWFDHQRLGAFYIPIVVSNQLE